MKTISEQIADLEATRKAKEKRMDEIFKKSSDEGRTLEASEAEEFDNISAECDQIDADVARLKKLEAFQAKSAGTLGRVVDGKQKEVETDDENPNARRRSPQAVVKNKDEDFKGQNYTRTVIAKALSHIYMVPASVIAEKRWGKTNPLLVALIKANEVPGGGSGSGEWGHELVQADTRYTGDFVEFLYNATVFDQLGLREVPKNVAIKGQDGQGQGYWVGESKAIPNTVVDFSSVNLTPLKVGAIAVVSNELLRDSTPAAERLVQDALINASAQRIDTTFFSAAAAVAGVSPAGILNGLTAITSAGNSGDAVRVDNGKLYAPFIAAKNAKGLVQVMTPGLAKNLSLMTNSFGTSLFPDISTTGGKLLGDQVFVGDNVPSGDLILLKPSDIWKIGDGGVEVSISRDAMIEQSSAPTGATDTPVAASQVFTSMFQEESTAIKVVRSINFAKRRASAVQYVTGVDYNQDGT